MAVDQGLKDTYLDKIALALASRKDRLDRNGEQQKNAQLEQAALAGLSASDRATAIGIGLVGKLDLAALQAEEAQLRSEVNNLQALRAAIKAL